jgi:hypothetical protein
VVDACLSIYISSDIDRLLHSTRKHKLQQRCRGMIHQLCRLALASAVLCQYSALYYPLVCNVSAVNHLIFAVECIPAPGLQLCLQPRDFHLCTVPAYVTATAVCTLQTVTDTHTHTTHHMKTLQRAVGDAQCSAQCACVRHWRVSVRHWRVSVRHWRVSARVCMN